MSTKRTPTQTSEHVARSAGGMKQTTMYHKKVTIDLYGNDPAELTAVAASTRLAASSHALVVGGKTKRKVSVHHGDSMTPIKIFDGVVG
jgi:hypothetical protein